MNPNSLPSNVNLINRINRHSRRSPLGRASWLVCAFAAIALGFILNSGCNSADRETSTRDTRADRSERERPLTVASKSDADRPSSRRSRRPASSRRAHIEPTPAGYGDTPSTPASTAHRDSPRVLRHVEPPSQHAAQYSQPTPPPSDTYVAPPAEAPPPDSSIRVYHVQRGDTLWSLAKRFYGDSKHWRRILAANRNRVPDPRNLPVGIKLIIP